MTPNSLGKALKSIPEGCSPFPEGCSPFPFFPLPFLFSTSLLGSLRIEQSFLSFFLFSFFPPSILFFDVFVESLKNRLDGKTRGKGENERKKKKKNTPLGSGPSWSFFLFSLNSSFRPPPSPSSNVALKFAFPSLRNA